METFTVGNSQLMFMVAFPVCGGSGAGGLADPEPKVLLLRLALDSNIC